MTPGNPEAVPIASGLSLDGPSQSYVFRGRGPPMGTHYSWGRLSFQKLPAGLIHRWQQSANVGAGPGDPETRCVGLEKHGGSPSPHRQFPLFGRSTPTRKSSFFSSVESFTPTGAHHSLIRSSLKCKNAGGKAEGGK